MIDVTYIYDIYRQFSGIVFLQSKYLKKLCLTDILLERAYLCSKNLFHVPSPPLYVEIKTIISSSINSLTLRM